MTQAIVIDTSSILRIAKDDEDGRAELQASDGKSLVAPESVRWELVNALAQGVFKRKITPAAAWKALHAADSYAILYLDIDRDAALKMAIERRIMSYDAFVLQCAIENDLPLLTSEKDEPGKMPHHAKELGIQLVKVTQ